MIQFLEGKLAANFDIAATSIHDERFRGLVYWEYDKEYLTNSKLWSAKINMQGSIPHYQPTVPT